MSVRALLDGIGSIFDLSSEPTSYRIARMAERSGLGDLLEPRSSFSEEVGDVKLQFEIVVSEIFNANQREEDRNEQAQGKEEERCLDSNEATIHQPRT